MWAERPSRAHIARLDLEIQALQRSGRAAALESALSFLAGSESLWRILEGSLADSLIVHLLAPTHIDPVHWHVPPPDWRDDGLALSVHAGPHNVEIVRRRLMAQDCSLSGWAGRSSAILSSGMRLEVCADARLVYLENSLGPLPPSLLLPQHWPLGASGDVYPWKPEPPTTVDIGRIDEQLGVRMTSCRARARERTHLVQNDFLDRLVPVCRRHQAHRAGRRLVERNKSGAGCPVRIVALGQGPSRVDTSWLKGADEIRVSEPCPPGELVGAVQAEALPLLVLVDEIDGPWTGYIAEIAEAVRGKSAAVIITSQRVDEQERKAASTALGIPVLALEREATYEDAVRAWVAPLIVPRRNRQGPV
jgi:hypothetical protein